MENSLNLHIHDDIGNAAKFYNIPLSFYNNESVYIMQQDRCVFVGDIENAEKFYENNNGKFCKSKFPLNAK